MLSITSLLHYKFNTTTHSIMYSNQVEIIYVWLYGLKEVFLFNNNRLIAHSYIESRSPILQL